MPTLGKIPETQPRRGVPTVAGGAAQRNPRDEKFPAPIIFLDLFDSSDSWCLTSPGNAAFSPSKAPASEGDLRSPLVSLPQSSPPSPSPSASDTDEKPPSTCQREALFPQCPGRGNFQRIGSGLRCAPQRIHRRNGPRSLDRPDAAGGPTAMNSPKLGRWGVRLDLKFRLPVSQSGAKETAVRSFLTYLMLLGVFAGLGIRAVGNPIHQEGPVCLNCVENPADHDCNGGDSSSSGEKHCPECPSEPNDHHHHKGSCCAAGVLFLSEYSPIRLAPLNESRALIAGSEDLLPDSPLLSEDKPPLI